MAVTPGYVQWNLEVPIEDAERFLELYPMDGSRAWFIRRALRAFLSLHDVSPDDLLSAGMKELRSLSQVEMEPSPRSRSI